MCQDLPRNQALNLQHKDEDTRDAKARNPIGGRWRGQGGSPGLTSEQPYTVEQTNE